MLFYHRLVWRICSPLRNRKCTSLIFMAWCGNTTWQLQKTGKGLLSRFTHRPCKFLHTGALPRRLPPPYLRVASSCLQCCGDVLLGGGGRQKGRREHPATEKQNTRVNFKTSWLFFLPRFPLLMAGARVGSWGSPGTVCVAPAGAAELPYGFFFFYFYFYFGFIFRHRERLRPHSRRDERASLCSAAELCCLLCGCSSLSEGFEVLRLVLGDAFLHHSHRMGTLDAEKKQKKKQKTTKQ